MVYNGHREINLVVASLYVPQESLVVAGQPAVDSIIFAGGEF